MPKPLSEIMKSPDVGRPQRTFPICVSGKLVAELEAADQELFAAQTELEAAQHDKRPGRVGAKSPIPALERAVKEKAAVCDAIRERMEDTTILLHLEAAETGAWRRWALEHPARDEDEQPAGHKRDRVHAAGYCDIDALISELGSYVTAYGDDQATPEAWEFVAANAAPGDLTRLASTVVAMHEQVVDLGKSRLAWLNDRRTSDSSE